MGFIEDLRQARHSRVAVLHEFLTQYRPHGERVHAFFEGQDDVTYFAPRIRSVLADGASLISYRCDGKAKVYEAFVAITGRFPNIARVLFFVDKDLDDVVGAPWPTDPRIFVTDVYSIENYCVEAGILLGFYRDCLRVRGTTFDEGTIEEHFRRELRRFQVRILPVMAWILVARRGGLKPNLSNLNLGNLFRVSDACNCRSVTRERDVVLGSATGVVLGGDAKRQVRAAARELARISPKRVVRGKFELWFAVEFWKQLVKRLDQLAKEAGGRVGVKVELEHSRALLLLAPYSPTPRGLELFLRAHLRSGGAGIEETDPLAPDAGSILGRLWRWLRGNANRPSQ